VRGRGEWAPRYNENDYGGIWRGVALRSWTGAAAQRFRGESEGLFVDYTELPDAVWNRVCPHFGISPSDADVQRMREIARYDTKNPTLLFDTSREAETLL
jgi:hypothetical protein